LRERVCVLAKWQMDKKALQPYMRVLGTNSSGSTIGPSENYGHWYLPSRHIVWFCSRINDVVNCLQQKPKSRTTKDYFVKTYSKRDLKHHRNILYQHHPKIHLIDVLSGAQTFICQYWIRKFPSTRYL
jgi:hypothetical protein